MPSKYKSKLPKPPFKKYAKRPDKAFCANCGYVCCLDRNLRGKPRGSARGSSEQAGTACGATSVASGQLACEVQQGQPHQPLPTAMLLGE